MIAVQTDSVITEEGAVALQGEKNKLQGGLIGRLRLFFNSFSVTRSKSTYLQFPTALRYLSFFILTVMLFVSTHILRAEDLLAAQKATTNDTLGHGSTVEWILYLAEIIVSVFSYIKTRNPMVFFGLIILFLVTRSFFALIG